MSVESDLTSSKVVEQVEYLLIKYPQLRDNDKLLWLAFACEFKGLKHIITPETYKIFKAWLMRPDTPMYESISRCRRKLQEHNPNLRGDGYNIKQESAENISEMMING